MLDATENVYTNDEPGSTFMKISKKQGILIWRKSNTNTLSMDLKQE